MENGSQSNNLGFGLTRKVPIMYPQNKSLISALTRSGFFTDINKDGNRYRVVKGDKILTWVTQGTRALTVHCGKLSDPRDSRVDYFPGHYAQTIKEAIAYLQN
jgi:hypothetical protein